MLRAAIRLSIGKLDLDAELEVAEGEVLAIVGPNGAGKTTILRTIAGLQPLDDGRIELDGEVLEDPDDDIFVPPAERSIGLVFQDYLLFPRLSALDNIAFGLRSRGASRAAARQRAAEWLERFGLSEHTSAKPQALSGGQAQRVALARALAVEPRLLLLDEPLAALDTQSRTHVRAELRSHLSDYSGTRLLVTHDPIDAMILADRLVTLEDGRITQPSNVADLMGVNLLHGQASGEHTVRLDSGVELTVADPLAAKKVAIAVRPQAISLHRGRPPAGSPRNVWPTTVADVRPDHDRVRVELAEPVRLVAEVTPAALADLNLQPGSEIWAAVKAVDLAVYER